MTTATTGMLDRTLWVAISSLREPKQALAPHLDAHLAFMIELERTGVLFASGPFRSGGTNTGSGLTIVRAESADAARAILDGDPFVRAGVRSYELHEWHILEGCFQLTVLASQQRGLLP